MEILKNPIMAARRLADYPLLMVIVAAGLWAASAAGFVMLAPGASAQVTDSGLQTSVGIANKIVREVKGKRGAYVRQIALKDEIYQNERISTGPGAAAEIVLRDNTRISVGPNSSLVLDKFVFDPMPSRRKVVMNAVGGVFRFATGNSPSNSYQIKTTSATLGIRGTIFTLIVAFNGAATVVVTGGAVLFANLAGDAVLVTPGLSSSIQPPAADGTQSAPSAPTEPSLPITSTTLQIENTLAETTLTDLASISTGGDPTVSSESGRPTGSSTPGASGSADGPGSDAAVEQVPAKALLGAINGSDDGMRALREFMQAGDADPETVAKRAMSILRALKNIPEGATYDVLVAAADRISEAASNIFNTGSIMRLTVDDAFLKPDGSFAFDLQPPDGDVSGGWEEVTPRDERVGGSGLRGLHRPGGDPVTTDGILGVESFDVAVPNDMWRVIILTEDLGTQQAGDAAINYFGDELRVNDDSISFRKTDPEDWSQTAFLTNQILDSGFTQSAGADGGDAAGGLIGDVATQQAGVVVSETEVTNNLVALQFVTGQTSGQRSKRTYVTGVIVEPIEEESSVRGFPPRAWFDLESLITQAIAEILADVEPEAGDPDVDLFEDNGESPSPA